MSDIFHPPGTQPTEGRPQEAEATGPNLVVEAGREPEVLAQLAQLAAGLAVDSESATLPGGRVVEREASASTATGGGHSEAAGEGVGVSDATSVLFACAMESFAATAGPGDGDQTAAATTTTRCAELAQMATAAERTARAGADAPLRRRRR